MRKFPDRHAAIDLGESAAEMPDTAPPLKVFVVDDHPVMLQGIGMLLEKAGVDVVGTASEVAEALPRIAAARPQVVLVDLGLGEESGLALLRELPKGPQAPRGLVFSMNEDAASVELALAAGAGGYVTKAEVWDTLVAALRTVAAGGRFLSPRASRALREPPKTEASGNVELSAREREVFRLLGLGFSSSEIGARLQVSRRTVESYCARLQEKLRLTGMRELRRLAIAAHKR